MSSRAGKPTWTARVREAGVAALPPEKLLADRQPVYVATWIYVFGVLSLSAFLVILVSGAVIALAGPAWWHTSSLGHFVITGAIAFLVSIATAFTGYLSQQNLDSQWIGGQAKDGLNAAGIGAFFNVLNFGQMLLWHVVLLPLAVAFLIGVHILQVRRRGVVPPLPVKGDGE
jgi:quinol-cytochrome oxidoreductase complex cytochrome b subunit